MIVCVAVQRPGKIGPIASRDFRIRGDYTLTEQQNKTDLSQFIAENFGANATYVEGLLSRFRNDPALVDESWRAYFSELLAGAPPPQTQENGRASSTQAGADGGNASSATSATASAPAAASVAPAPKPTVKQISTAP